MHGVVTRNRMKALTMFCVDGFGFQEWVMRLRDDQVEQLKNLATEVGGSGARLRLFGSRVDDTARGGDVDLLLELADPVDDPATLIARMEGLASRALDERTVDVALLAPNLKRLPIHDAALRTGVEL